MTPELSGQLASAAAKAAEQQQPKVPAGPGEAAEGDVAKFEKLMSDGQTEKPGDAQAVADRQHAGPTQALDGAQQVQSPKPEQRIDPVKKADGSELVDRLSDAGKEIQAKRQEILDRLANAKDLSPKELLEMQFKLAELTMQQTMIGKAGEKGEQAVQQLFRG